MTVAPQDVFVGVKRKGAKLKNSLFWVAHVVSGKVPEKIRSRERLPCARAKAASLGIGMGGADSFRFAADVPNLDAAVVFYGVAPDETVLPKIKAPIAGLHSFTAETDCNVAKPTVNTTKADNVNILILDFMIFLLCVRWMF